MLFSNNLSIPAGQVLQWLKFIDKMYIWEVLTAFSNKDSGVR